MVSAASASDVYECDGCQATVCCTKTELTQLYRWRQHKGEREGVEWLLTLCEECNPKPLAKKA